MHTAKQSPAPFGSRCKRFGKSSLHPGLDKQGLFIPRPKACDPCYYSPKPLHLVCAATHKQFNEKDPWRYKSEVEEWSANLGYRNQKILARRKWDRTLLGPAWYDVREPPPFEAACPNVGFGRTPRKGPVYSKYPGPGTYYKTIPFKAPYGPHSSRPSFDREEPCRFKDPSTKWSLAPSRYIIVDKESVAEKSNKLVSIRGPYDLFSGTRDGPIMNHFNTNKIYSKTWPLAFKGCLERYKKTRFGVMNKTGRDKPHRGRNTLTDVSMCIRKAEDPGAASYNVRKPIVFVQNLHGFNSSNLNPVGYKPTIIWPGVGRYKLSMPSNIMGQGHKHVFNCKIPRTGGSVPPETLNSF